MGGLGFTSNPQEEFWIYVGLSSAVWFLLVSAVRLLIRAQDKYVRRNDVDESSKPSKWSREMIAQRWATSTFSSVWEITAALLALVSVGIFLVLAGQVTRVDTKATDPDWTIDDYADVFRKDWVIWAEFFLSIFFVVDFLVHFVIEANKFDYVTSASVFVMVATCTAGFLGPLHGIYFYDFEFLRIIRIYQMMVFFSTKSNSFVPSVVTQVAVMVLTILSLMLCAAGFMFCMENNVAFELGQIVTVLDAFYMVMVSLTTVGYGDICPKSDTGKFMVMIMIASGIAVVPIQAEKIVRLIRERRDKAHREYQGRGHLVVMAPNGNPVIPFLKEFFHEDRESTNVNICLMLQTDEVSRDVEAILSDPLYAPRVEQLQGQPISEEDLNRSKLHSAEACFLFCNKQSPDNEDEDAKTTLNTFAIRRYDHSVSLYVQVMDPRNKYALRAADANVIVCVNELRLGVIAQSCLCPGFASFVGNLIQSYAPPTPENSKDRKYPRWLLEYTLGAGHEAYVVEDLKNFAGMNFIDAVNIIYETFGALLVGVNVDGSTKKRRHYKQDRTDVHLDPLVEGKLILNPGHSFIIREGHSGIVICQDESIVADIESLNARLRAGKDKFNFKKPVYNVKAASIYNLDFDVSDINNNNTRPFSSAHVKTVEPLGLKNHIVVIGNFFDVSNFVLRWSKYQLKVKRPIVILSPTIPDEFSWDSIAHVNDVYFVQGISTRQTDLQRAGALTADSVVMLGEGDRENALSDARPISIFRLVKTGANPIIDLVDISNAKYLGSIGNEIQAESDIENPYYAAGQVFSTQCLDTLTVQSYFNASILPLVEQLVDGSVFPIKVSKFLPEFIGRSYLALFQQLLENDMVALALYRRSKDSRLCYTLTNPESSTVVAEDDTVMVLDAVNSSTRESFYKSRDNQQPKEVQKAPDLIDLRS